MRILLWIVLIAWLLAFFRTLLNLLSTRFLPAAASDDGTLVSVVIPARDEARTIERTIRAMLAQTHRNLELIVVDDRSADQTGTIADGIALEDPRLRVIHGEEPPLGWLGKPWALHQGSARASGAVLLFVDADIVYAPDAVARAITGFRASGAAMMMLVPRFEMRGFWENVLIPQLAVFFFGFLPVWLANRTRIAMLGAGGGSGNLIDRAVYAEIGGHTALRDAVVDDVGLARLVRRSGHPTVVARADDCISVRMYHGLRETIEGFTKNAFAVMGRSYALTLLATAGAIVFHVLPYAVALSGDRLALTAVAVITLTRVVLFRSLRYPLAYALFAHPLMVSVWAYIFLRSMWFTGVQSKLRWRGRTYDAARTRFGGDIRAGS
ncbi:MAG TPA: glycosyltransferase family 2 protein [Thermoanaerobaculia bacterium]|nr:glycosyltransferase family 2 protein [Thermoanaerobaculia bacterium]